MVVSAMGKTTNKLLAIAATAIQGDRAAYIHQIHDLRDYHSREARIVVPLQNRAELDRTIHTLSPFCSTTTTFTCCRCWR